ncbi:MAG: hypothetical protein AAB586_00335 [Patescibacteria group bacterium]
MLDIIDKDKKPEKLASALYLITSFLNDQEPLKWKLRSLATDLVSVAMSLKEKQIVSPVLRDIIFNITGLLSVTKNVGLVSAENNDLMQEEFIKYIDAIGYPKNVSDILKSESPAPEIKRLEKASVLKDKSLKEFGAVSVKKNSRQNVIIALLKRKKEIMIKDVSPLIDGCSEKTIQRELSTMVQAGILSKMGEKRWSRYSLARPQL